MKWARTADTAGPRPNLLQRSDTVHATCSEIGCGRPAKSVGRCKFHYQRWYRSPEFQPAQKGLANIVPAEERFWKHVTKTSTCWLWTGAKTRGGYGHFKVGERTIRAARFSYELHRWPIPFGLMIDHLCRVTACVNPDHLELVTHRENMRRVVAARTACPHGHAYTEQNTHWYRGFRTCRTCHRLNERKRRARLAA
jgi:hypothetical protein